MLGIWDFKDFVNGYDFFLFIQHPASSPALAGFRLKSRPGGIGLRQSFAR
jgi:hypothetical protein